MIQANTNNRWARLSQSEKAELLGIYASKGYHDLANIIAHYNSCGGKLYKDGGHREQNIGDKATINNKYYDVERERPMYDYLRDNGLNSYQTAGLLGNLSVESYLKADLQQIGGPAYGLMQAEAGRQKAMRNYNDVPYQFGSNLTPEEQQQLDYIINKGIKEYTPGEWGRKGFKGAREARNAFLNVNDTQTATKIIRDNFLRPGKPHKERRGAMAEYFDEKMMSQFPYNTEKYSHEYLYGSGGKIHIKPENRGKLLEMGGPGWLNAPFPTKNILRLLDPEERKMIMIDKALREREEERERIRIENEEKAKESARVRELENEARRSNEERRMSILNNALKFGTDPVYILRGYYDKNNVDTKDEFGRKDDRVVIGRPGINYEQRDLGDKTLFINYPSTDSVTVAPIYRSITLNKNGQLDTLYGPGTDRELWDKIDKSASDIISETILTYKKNSNSKTSSNNGIKFPFASGGPLTNYLYSGGPYGVIPLGGDYLSYLQSIPEIYGGYIEPSVITAALPAKFNGSQEAARRYAEGYQKGAKPVSEAMNRAGQKIFNTVDTVVGLTPTPAGAISWLGHMGADTMNGEYGKVAKDAAMAAAMGLGLKAIGKGATYLKNYWDEIGNFGEDTFRAFTDRVPGRVSTNFTYELPATRNAIEEAELAREFRLDQLGVDDLIRPARNGGWSPEELMRLQIMAGDHPMDLAAYTPEQIAQAQAQMQADASIIHDALAGNRATGPAERFVSSGPVAGAKTASGYQIERYPGYMLKSLLEGNPLEKQLSKSGEINVGNLRNYIKSKDIKAVDKAVMEKVLASEEFAGKKSIDYNRFRKAVQDELITYDRTPDTRWEDYGLSRMGFDLESDYTMPVIDAPEYDTMRDFINGTNSKWRINQRNGKPVFVDRNNKVIPKEEVDKYYVKWLEENEIPIIEKSIPRASTYIFSSERIPNGSGKHYDPNTLGHSRTYTTADEPDVLHVMESQSDWAQSKPSELLKTHDIKSVADLDEEIAFQKANAGEGYKGVNWKDELAKLEAARPYVDPETSYLADNYTSRQIQENLRYAAEKGQTKMRYPTRETAAKIEGYPEREAYFDSSGKDVTKERVYTYGEKEDARLDEINKELRRIENERNSEYRQRKPEFIEEIRKKDDELYTSLIGEQLRIKSAEPRLKTGITKKTVYDYEDILRKYADFPKQFKKLYKNADVRIVTDSKGNTWYEVDVPENYLQREWAYKYGGPLQQYADFSGLF